MEKITIWKAIDKTVKSIKQEAPVLFLKREKAQEYIEQMGGGLYWSDTYSKSNQPKIIKDFLKKNEVLQSILSRLDFEKHTNRDLEETVFTAYMTLGDMSIDTLTYIVNFVVEEFLEKDWPIPEIENFYEARYDYSLSILQK